ncbi:hypothetical protein RRG08_030701 [Elysia crispata]|uniref:G-protein coupled receptors family 1 profile domain-containing protein n=1 Tax=Elysia crispata TaxID=231223 RepID=A0AAE0Y5B0_9GAST|nr:hypothetical protein RRG08_030701 [Elysia crispata]
MSNSSYKDELSVVTLTDAGLSMITLCLALFITSANATTVVAIWRTPALRTLANTYVCSLACVDFVVGLVCVLLALFLLPPVRLELFFKHIEVCSLFQGTIVGMSALSAIHMTLIAVDRYLYIIKPYFYQRVINFRVVAIFLAIAWGVGLIISFLPQFIAKPYGEVPLCDITQRQPIWYTFYTCTVLFGVLCVVNVIMYSIILNAAAKQRKAVRANVPISHQNGKGQGNSSNISKGTMKSIKFFLTVFGVFLVCGTPTVVVMGLDYYSRVPSQVYRFLNVVAVANSGMNFIIYAAMNKQFRQAFLRNSALARCRNSPACCCLHGCADKQGEISDKMGAVSINQTVYK